MVSYKTTAFLTEQCARPPPYLVSMLFTDLLFLHLVTFLMFFILVIYSSGNRTPGSRFYSDLLDTLADFVCIHQLILQRRSWPVPIN